MARTKATILSLDEVTDSEAAIDRELHPQLWSMGQPPFKDLVRRLQSQIRSSP